jgi:hypothetical protein
MNGFSREASLVHLDAVLQRARSERALFLRTSLSSRMNQTKDCRGATVFVWAVAALGWLRGRLAALHVAL